MRQLRGAGAARFRDGDDHIDLVGRHGGDHAFGEGLTQIQTRLVDGDVVHHRIRAGQVHKFKNAGVELWVVCALLRVDGAVQRDEHGFARVHIALELEARAFQRNGFAGQYRAVTTFAHAQRANAKRVAEGQHTVARNQRDDRVRALDALVYIAHGGKDVQRLQRQAACRFFDLVRQHIEQNLGIALGVDVAVVGEEQLALERMRVGQIAVVHQHDTEWRVHVERLGLFFAIRIARRGVTHLAQAAVARQRAHIARAKHITHHALCLVHEELAFLLRDDTRCILAAVLQQQQGVINQLIDWCMADNANYSAHSVFLI